MLREALAIQVDANKAVASAVAARDRGEGDEEIVRPFCAARFVVSLNSLWRPSAADTAEGLM